MLRDFSRRPAPAYNKVVNPRSLSAPFDSRGSFRRHPFEDFNINDADLSPGGEKPVGPLEKSRLSWDLQFQRSRLGVRRLAGFHVQRVLFIDDSPAPGDTAIRISIRFGFRDLHSNIRALTR